MYLHLLMELALFQSTLSVRRATIIDGCDLVTSLISIHALRKESDLGALLYSSRFFISIHALRKESDVCHSCFGRKSAYFNPRSP